MSLQNINLLLNFYGFSYSLALKQKIRDFEDSFEDEYARKVILYLL